MRYCVAVDIGGTKLAAAVVDESGFLLAQDQTPTVGADGEALFDTLTQLIDTVVATTPVTWSEVTAMGVGCGGPMRDANALISPLNIAQWRDFALASRLAQRFEVAVHVDNDAKALALGEGWKGAAVGESNYLAMVVSTGVGGGLVVNGVLLDGGDHNAGHLGHLIVVPGGRRCACGARGCLEAEVSGTAIRAATGRSSIEAPEAVRIRAGRLVGEAVASVCNLLDLRLALVGGSVALGFGPPFFAAAQRAVDESCRLTFSRGARILPVGLGAAGPLIGAAAVAWRGAGVDVRSHCSGG